MDNYYLRNLRYTCSFPNHIIISIIFWILFQVQARLNKIVAITIAKLHLETLPEKSFHPH